MSLATQYSVRSRVVLGIGLAVCVGAAYVWADWWRCEPENVNRTYVGRASCADCHQQESKLFQGSHHDRAMDIASDETVLAKFDGRSIEHHGTRSRVYRLGEKFMVQTEGPDGNLHDYHVTHVFGVDPIQQFIVPVDEPASNSDGGLGRMQVLRLTWDVQKQDWFHLDPPDVSGKLEPDDPLHWTGISQCWNTTCAYCHSTNLKKNFDVLTRDYSTTFSEIDVSCEACHGPGSLHVKLATSTSLFWDRLHGYGLAKLKSTSNIPQVESCAPCHSRRRELVDDYAAGQPFDSCFANELISTRTYFADGQQRDEVYTHNSFLQSRMYQNGIRCTDCHDPHSARVKYPDNQLCTSCHQHPASKYDTPEHHHHKVGSPGGQCVECHMPATTYMDVDPRRDHSLRVPRPDVSVRLKTPNACTGCHIDPNKLPVDVRAGLKQYADWMLAAESGNELVARELAALDGLMAQATENWYSWSANPPKSQYYEQLAEWLGSTEKTTETARALISDVNVPPIVRASAAEHLANFDDGESLELAIAGLDSNLSGIAEASLQRIDAILAQRRPIQELLSDSVTKSALHSAAQLLMHPARSVQIAAARTFQLIPRDALEQVLDQDQLNALPVARDKLLESLAQENDRARSHALRGYYYEVLGQTDAAIDCYRTAIAVEPNATGARVSLALMLEAQAEQLSQRLQQQASQIDANTIRLLVSQRERALAEAARLRADEHVLLGREVARSTGYPGAHVVHYQFAMSSYLHRDFPLVEEHLRLALREQPMNETYLLAMATFLFSQQKLDEAKSTAEKLLEIDRENREYAMLMQQILDAIRQPK